MSSSIKRNSYTYQSDDTANVKGALYKIGTSKTNVTKCTSATDIGFGICQDEVGQVLAAGDAMELAVIGGGGKALANGTISAMQELAFNGTGFVAATTTQWVSAIALESAVSGDIFSVFVTGYHKV